MCKSERERVRKSRERTCWLLLLFLFFFYWTLLTASQCSRPLSQPLYCGCMCVFECLTCRSLMYSIQFPLLSLSPSPDTLHFVGICQFSFAMLFFFVFCFYAVSFFFVLIATRFKGSRRRRRRRPQRPADPIVCQQL